MTFPQFPKDFLFGTAIAAFQIEGSPTTDGKSKSAWVRSRKHRTKSAFAKMLTLPATLIAIPNGYRVDDRT